MTSALSARPPAQFSDGCAGKLASIATLPPWRRSTERHIASGSGANTSSATAGTTSQALSASRKLLGITRKPAEEAVAEALESLDDLPDTELLKAANVARILGLPATEESLSQWIVPRGYRVLGRIPRVQMFLMNKIISVFGDLKALLKQAELEVLIDDSTNSDEAEESKPAPDIVEAARLDGHQVVVAHDLLREDDLAVRALAALAAVSQVGEGDGAVPLGQAPAVASHSTQDGPPHCPLRCLGYWESRYSRVAGWLLHVVDELIPPDIRCSCRLLPEQS